MMDKLDKQRYAKIYRQDPAKFFVDALDVKQEYIWPKMEEICWSVRDNRRTVVKAGNGVSKSYTAARLALWFLYTHYPSTVVTTAPSYPQVEEILWREIRLAHAQAKFPLGGDVTKTKIDLGEKWFALGFATKPDTVTQQATRFQGFHNDNILIIFDEAAGILKPIWEAKDRLMTAGNCRFLAIGNPTSPVGDFAECFNNDIYNHITVSVKDTPNYREGREVIPGLSGRDFETEVIAEYGVKSNQYKSSITGEIPTNSDRALISWDWVEAARHKESEDDYEDSIKIVAADIATKHGDCYTVVGSRYGNTAQKIDLHRKIPTTSSAGLIRRFYEDIKADVIVVDSDGVGEGVSDILTEQRIGVTEFHGGYASKAIDNRRYKNLRTQFYCMVAKKFEKGLYSLKNLPEKTYQMLKMQLCAIEIKAPDSQGRIQIETKEDMQARGIKSPDLADWFIYSEYGFYCGRMADVKEYCFR